MNTVTRYAIAYLTTDNIQDTRYDQHLYIDANTAVKFAWGIAHGYLRSLGIDSKTADAAVTSDMRGYQLGRAVTIGNPVTGQAAITVMVIEHHLPGFLVTDTGVQRAAY